jgi:hypothetical protein
MSLFVKYRVKKQNNKYFVQRRYLFLNWVNVAEYNDSYKANMIMIALKHD